MAKVKKVAMINANTKTKMYVDEKRKGEYLKAGHKMAGANTGGAKNKEAETKEAEAKEDK